MPITRTLTFKLIVPRSHQDATLRQALWRTHATLNAAVAYYQRQLLLMRALPYRGEDDVVVTQAALERQRDHLVAVARQHNSHLTPLVAHQRDEVAQWLYQLYVAIVPAHVGEKGTAQNTKGFLDGLTRQDSRFGLSVFDKLGHIPDWVSGVRNGEATAFVVANTWLASDEGQARQQMIGAPPGWLRRLRAGDTTWPTAFIDDLDKKRQEAAGYPTALKRLRERGVLPLFRPYISPHLVANQGTLTPWDRLAWRLAVAHLLSWESSCRQAATEHAQRSARVEAFKQRHMTPAREPLVEHLRRYEQARHIEQAARGLLTRRAFRVMPSMLRGWPILRERWQKHARPTADQLLADLAAEQAKRRGRFGDPSFFYWLAQPEQHSLWYPPDSDIVEWVSQLNRLQSLVERCRETATLTLADARYHPRWVEWAAPGDKNLRNYRLEQTAEGALVVTLPLLQSSGDALDEIAYCLPLAPSGQCRQPVLMTPKKGKYHLHYRGSTDETYDAEWRAVNLSLDRSFLRNRSLDRIAQGEMGSVFLQAAVDLAPQYPPNWPTDRPKAVNFFLSARGNDKYVDHVQPPLRVLVVDLGVHQMATCSVFELVKTRPVNQWAIPVENGLWALHERSFRLTLPGEAVDRHGEQWRRQAMNELERLRRTLGRYRRLYRFAGLLPETRMGELDAWQAEVDEPDSECWPFESALLDRLRACVTATPTAWEGQIKTVQHDFRRHFGSIVSDWRQQTRRRLAGRAMGQSVWAIHYLIDVSRFLQSWSLLGTYSGDSRQLDKTRGTFTTHLLDHIRAMKENRWKTGANLIVQAARGYQRNPAGQWLLRHAPCPVILFEDNSRFYRRTDRPPSENVPLMKWAYRAIPQAVAMQGELYGLHVCETTAAFSSRFHAVTEAPGIRCHALRQQDVADTVFLERLVRDNPRFDPASQQLGDWVPLADGAWFVCLGDKGQTIRVDAAVNAAQHVQRRFWTRHGRAFRLPCLRVTDGQGQVRWVPRSLGKRALGALGQYGCLIPTGDDTGACCWEPLTRAQWARFVGDGAVAEDSSSTLDLSAALDAESWARSSETVVFFRDPSGCVLPTDRWFPAAHFWSVVQARTVKALN